MMRFWREEYVKPERRGFGTATSVVVHGGLILLAVLATNPPPGLVSLWDLANRVYYLPPTPKLAPSEGSAAQMKFVDHAPTGDGSGFASSMTPSLAPVAEPVTSKAPGDQGSQPVASAEAPVTEGTDSAFTIVEVDSAARTDPMSAAPAYPEALQKIGVEGFVSVKFVVDSTGLADPSSLVVVRTSRVEFAVAVRQALPYMHFVPARIGAKRVRQWVAQDYNFKIQRKPGDSTAVAPKKPPV